LKNPKVSIQTKLLVILLAFSILFVGAVAIAINYELNNRFESYVRSNFKTRAGQLVEAVASAYVKAGSFKKINVQKIDLGNAMGVEIEVTDLKGRKVLTVSKHMMGVSSSAIPMMHNMQHATGVEPAKISLPLVVEGRKVANVKITSMMEGGGLWRQQDIDFQKRLNNSILIVGLILTALAAITSFGLAKIFTRPVSALSLAASKISQGDLSARADASSSDELGSLADLFNQMAQSLEQEQKERQNMLSDISHELRTPLAVIRSNLEALQDGLLSPTKQNLQSVHDEVLRLSNLINDLQTLALTDSASLTLSKTRINVFEVITQSLKKMDVFLKTKQIKIDFKSAHKVEIAADAEKLKQVIFNLLFNAYKFLKEEGKIDISVAAEKESVQIKIKDNGAGIKASELPHIFERFYSSDKSSGSGIGLAVVKKLVDAHGGTINVESEDEKGTIFTIELPTD